MGWLASFQQMLRLNPNTYAAAAAKSLQSCPTLLLDWVAISFSNAWKWKVKVKSLSCVQLLATPWTAAYQVPPSMGFSRQSTISNPKRWCCESAALNMPANLENSAVATGLEKDSSHSNPKGQCKGMFRLPHKCTLFTHWQGNAQNPSS